MATTKNIKEAPANTALVPVDSAQTAAKQLFADHEKAMTSHYISKQALASMGTLFTVLKVGERSFDATNDDERFDAADGDNGRDVYAVLVRLQEPIRFTNQANGKETDEAGGAEVIVTFGKSRAREPLFKELDRIIKQYGPVANVQCTFVELSAKAAAKGHSRAVTLALAS